MIVTNADQLGVVLRDARRAKGMSQVELAALVGVSRQWVINAEKGAPTAQLNLILTALRCVDRLVDLVVDDSGQIIDEIFGGKS